MAQVVVNVGSSLHPCEHARSLWGRSIICFFAWPIPEGIKRYRLGYLSPVFIICSKSSEPIFIHSYNIKWWKYTNCECKVRLWDLSSPFFLLTAHSPGGPDTQFHQGKVLYLNLKNTIKGNQRPHKHSWLWLWKGWSSLAEWGVREKDFSQCPTWQLIQSWCPVVEFPGNITRLHRSGCAPW